METYHLEKCQVHFLRLYSNITFSYISLFIQILPPSFFLVPFFQKDLHNDPTSTLLLLTHNGFLMLLSICLLWFLLWKGMSLQSKVVIILGTKVMVQIMQCLPCICKTSASIPIIKQTNQVCWSYLQSQNSSSRGRRIRSTKSF